MKDLAKWQVVSFLSRLTAMFIGIVQGALIFRILSQGEFGVKELALSIGGALGIYQHLGLASASTREVASAKDNKEIFKIFITSIFVRYCVTLPLSIGLFLFSGRLAARDPALKLPLQIYSLTLLVQGFQSLLNAVIAGTKRFKELFLYQILISIFSVIVHVPLVYFYRVNGFFYAFFIFNLVSTVILFLIAFLPMRNDMVFPSKEDFNRLLKELFSISFAIYGVKVIYTNWEKLGNNMLGLSISTQAVALYGFALVIAKKLMLISDSITSVNLPVLSEKFENDFEGFKKTFTHNFNKVFSIILIASSIGMFWASQVVILYGGMEKYLEYKVSLGLIPPLLLAFLFYSFINILHSSILVPAKMVKVMLFGYIQMALCTLGSYLLFKGFIDPLKVMAWSMSFGSGLGLYYISFSIKSHLDYTVFDYRHILLIIQSFVFGLFGLVDIFWIKALGFIPFLVLLIWALIIAKMIKYSDFVLLFTKFNERLPWKRKRILEN